MCAVLYFYIVFSCFNDVYECVYNYFVQYEEVLWYFYHTMFLICIYNILF